jgi:hypothetical protein
MATRQKLREQRERGLDVEQSEFARLQRIARAAEEAFSASTLTEAQTIIGSAIPALVTSITLSAPFDSPSGASPQATITATVTVPPENTGYITINTTSASGTYRMLVNGSPLLSIPSVYLHADGDTLQFDATAPGSAVTIELRDATTGAALCPSFTITAS